MEKRKNFWCRNCGAKAVFKIFLKIFPKLYPPENIWYVLYLAIIELGARTKGAPLIFVCKGSCNISQVTSTSNSCLCLSYNGASALAH